MASALFSQAQAVVEHGQKQKAARFHTHLRGRLPVGDTMSLRHHLAAILCLSAALGLVAPALQASPGNPRRTAVVEVVERVRGAVVNIHSERTVRGPAPEELFSNAPSQNRINGMGTGIIIDPRGYIITNQHVVDEVNAIRVRLSDGTTHTARIITRDPESDLALLKIDLARSLPVIPLGTSSDLMVGETVIAIGNAYGYEHTVSVGVISAINRDVTLNKELSYKALIQTDASINPGNSGGPLLNINGELIGVNVAIRAGAQGIGFAIPVDSVLRVAAEMLSVRRRNGTWHGVIGRDCVGEPPPAKAEGGRVKAQTVSNVTTASFASLSRWLVVERAEPGSPAARAGLQPGDVILQAGGVRVACGLELERALLDRAPGDSVPLLVRRKGAETHLDLVLQSTERSALPATDVIWRKLGLRLTPVSPEIVMRVNPQLHGGLAVIDLSPDGPASKAGVQRGDILLGLHQWETISLENVNFVLTHPDLASFNPLRFFILRAGQLHKGWLQQIE
jgi:serine protease Do